MKFDWRTPVQEYQILNRQITIGKHLLASYNWQVSIGKRQMASIGWQEYGGESQWEITIDKRQLPEKHWHIPDGKCVLEGVSL